MLKAREQGGGHMATGVNFSPLIGHRMRFSDECAGLSDPGKNEPDRLRQREGKEDQETTAQPGDEEELQISERGRQAGFQTGITGRKKKNSGPGEKCTFPPGQQARQLEAGEELCKNLCQYRLLHDGESSLESIRKTQENEDNAEALETYIKMLVERRTQVARILALLYDAQTEITEMIAEAAARRAKVTQNMAEKWAAVLGGYGER
jgi:hypothetical protein